MKQVLFLVLLLLSPAASHAQEKYMEHDADGKLRVLGYINKETGKKEGHWIAYGSNGRKIRETDYKNGEKEGREYDYDDAERVYTMRTFRNGLLDGPYLQYYDEPFRNGRLPLYVRSVYRDGQQEGMEYVYESDGTILHRRRYEQGMMVTDTSYAHNGIYITSWRRITDPTAFDGYRYKEVKEFTPYKHRPAATRQNKTTPQRRHAQPKRDKPQATPKKNKLRVGKNGTIEVG